MYFFWRPFSWKRGHERLDKFGIHQNSEIYVILYFYCFFNWLRDWKLRMNWNTAFKSNLKKIYLHIRQTAKYVQKPILKAFLKEKYFYFFLRFCSGSRSINFCKIFIFSFVKIKLKKPDFLVSLSVYFYSAAELSCADLRNGHALMHSRCIRYWETEISASQ